MEIKHANRFFMITIIVFLGQDLLWDFIPPIPDLYVEAARDVLLIIIGILMILLTRSGIRSSLGLYRITWHTAVLSIVLMLIAQPLSNLVVELSYFVSPDFMEYVWEDLMQENPVVDLLYIAVLPAIIEEFIFRGVLFQSWRHKSGRSLMYVAMLVGLEFGLFHMNLTQLSYAFVLGVLMCLLAEASGSILAPVIFHFANNAVAVIDDMLYTADSPVVPFLPLQYLTLETPYSAALTIVLSMISIPLMIHVLFRIAEYEGRRESLCRALKRRRTIHHGSRKEEDNMSETAAVQAAHQTIEYEEVIRQEELQAVKSTRRIFTPSLVIVTAFEIILTALTTWVLYM